MSEELMKRLAKLLWGEIARASNPWHSAVVSGLNDFRPRWEKWNNSQIELSREMFEVVFRKKPATADLLERALNFLEDK